MNAPKQNGNAHAVTVAHYLTAAICFLALASLIALAHDAFGGHYFQPRILAVTHLAALGWATCIVFGACYQLIPVILETGLYSIKLAWLSWLLFLPGVICLVYAFWIFVPGVHMQVGALLILTSVILFTLNIYITAIKTKKQTIQEDFIFSGCLCLCLTALVGTALVFNFTGAFLPKDQLHYLRLHAHLGLAGWFLLTIIGVSSKLVPMFVVSSYQNKKLLQTSYYLIVTALILFIVDSYFFGLNSKTYFIALIGMGGIGCYLYFIFKCLQTRKKRHIDLPMQHSLVSFILLAAALVCIPFIIFYYLNNNQLNIKFSFAYGALLLMGWISALILGQTFKTLPFIVWVKHYEHLTGKVKTPMPSDLYKRSLLRIQTTSFLGFCLSFIPGYLINSAMLTWVGCIALLVTALAYVANVLVVILHKTKIDDEL